MDDSEQEFADLCSKLLKRVRKGPVGGAKSGEEKKTEEESQPLTQTKERAKNRWLKNDVDPSSKRQLGCRSRPECLGQVVDGPMVSKGAAVTQMTTDTVVAPPATIGGETPFRVRDMVVRKMQKFKRVSPQRLKHSEDDPPEGAGPDQEHRCLSPPHTQGAGQEPQGDEALALRLQLEMEREALGETVDLEDGGLFFCQICQKDLSAMSPQRRAQHINRCLDDSEEGVPARPCLPRIPECPICGKGFKSQNSRAAHLKRCSTQMGVPPATLLGALQRQAAEAETATAMRGDPLGQPAQVGRSKRKSSTDPSCAVRKKPRRKSPALDEDTMVAMALSRSMVELKEEREAQLVAPPQAAPLLVLEGRGRRGAGTGQKRGKRKKGASLAPPPLLLLQDPQTALSRLQNRVAALLLRTVPPTPPTPGLAPSTLPVWTGSAPLWQKSALRDGGPSSVLEFYTPELSPPIEPWGHNMQGTPNMVPASLAISGPQVEPLSMEKGEHCPEKKPGTQPPAQSPVPSTPLVGSQTLCDLMDLAEEGLTLTQCGYVFQPVHDKDASVADLPFSGFVPERTETGRTTKNAMAMTRLAADLSNMVNNPQLSDVQLQVDSGDVFFSHSFMLYTRCPMLVQMVHESGFGVQEDRMAAAQRVLLGDVPPDAVLSLLQYLYTGHCTLTHTLVPHLQELAVRFNLGELEELCQRFPRGIATVAWDDVREPGQNATEECREHNFLELLRSMWEGEENEEEKEVGVTGKKGPREHLGEGSFHPSLGEGESREEGVDEEELDEIYEFAATQRRKECERGVREETGDEEEEDEEEVKEVSSRSEMEEEGDQNKKGEKEFSPVRTDDCDGKPVTEMDEYPTQASCPCLNISQALVGGYSGGPILVDPVTVLATDYNGKDKMGPDAVRPEVPGTDTAGSEGRRPDITGLGVARTGVANHSEPVYDTSLEKSYDRLFSQSWGEYVEPCPPLAGTPLPSKRPGSACALLPGEGSRLQSTAMKVPVIDLSVSPSFEPCLSSFPIAGLSPGSGELVGGEIQAAFGSLSGMLACSSRGLHPEKRESGDSSVSRPDKELELIVLSDSGEEMDVEPGNTSLGTEPLRPPCRLGLSQDLDGALAQLDTAREPRLSTRKAGDISTSGSRTSVGGSSGHTAAGGHFSHLDDSAEISWLVPGTPMQPGRIDRVKASLANCSTCCSKLFSSASSSSSSSLTSLRAPQNCAILQSEHLAQVGPGVEDSLNSGKLAGSSSFQNTDLGLSRVNDSLLQHRSDRSQSESYSAFADSPSKPRQSAGGLQPTSSTPLLTEPISFRRTLFPGPRKRAPYPSPGQSASPVPEAADGTCLGSFHGETLLSMQLSPMGDLKRSCRVALTQAGLHSPATGEQAEDEEEKPLSLQSFDGMDEPPIAYIDDSWGLGGSCNGGQVPCFSLRLDSSSGGSPSQGDVGGVGLSFPRPGGHADPQTTSELNSLLDSKVWVDWDKEEQQQHQEEEEEEKDGAELPLSTGMCLVAPVQRVAQLKTPVAYCRQKSAPLVPITPMPSYSVMETPELKNRLNRFGVRPLPKRQMVLKLKEIHQYTHQVLGSDSEEDSPALGPQITDCRPASPLITASHKLGSVSGAVGFKEPVGVGVRSLPQTSPVKQAGDEDKCLLSASQGSTASSTAASEDSERSNPEQCPLSDDESDSDEVTASQALSRKADKLLSVRQFILSDRQLYGQILQYQPLVLSELQARLKGAGIRLGTGKLLDFLDSQCITFTTAKPAKPGSPWGKARVQTRGRGKRRGGKAKTLG